MAMMKQDHGFFYPLAVPIAKYREKLLRLETQECLSHFTIWRSKGEEMIVLSEMSRKKPHSLY
jgi:hypothetical protein